MAVIITHSRCSWDGKNFQSIAILTEKFAGRRDECHDGLLFPPEQGKTQQAPCQVLEFLKLVEISSPMEEVFVIRRINFQ